ncbi:MAG: ribonuclease P protein component [Chloroflexota bacterium]
MLPKQYRLRKAADFARVRRFGRSSGHPLLSVYLLAKRPPDIRIGFTVSKKVGKAVTRNLVKRRLSEAIRPHLGDLRPGCDLVIIARPSAAGASYQDLAGALEKQLVRSGALRRREVVGNG